MSDSRILWRFIASEFTNDHPVVYLYVCGQKKSQETAINKAMSLLKEIFCPPYTVVFIKDILTEYLSRKKQQYINNEIKIKPIY